MDELREDMKSIRSDISEIKATIARNTVSLEHHMSRTAANETRIIYLERIFIGLGIAAIGLLLGVIIKPGIF